MSRHGKILRIDAALTGGSRDDRAPRPGRADAGVRLLIGTLKGAFLLRASGARGAWNVDGPHLAGRAVYALAHDGRAGRRRIWAGAASMH